MPLNRNPGRFAHQPLKKETRGEIVLLFVKQKPTPLPVPPVPLLFGHRPTYSLLINLVIVMVITSSDILA